MNFLFLTTLASWLQFMDIAPESLCVLVDWFSSISLGDSPAKQRPVAYTIGHIWGDCWLLRKDIIPLKWGWCKKCICRPHLEMEILLLVVNRPAYILGMIVIVLQVSEKDSVLRKRYMGVWRYQLAHLRAMRARLPVEGEQIESKKGRILSRVFTWHWIFPHPIVVIREVWCHF